MKLIAIKDVFRMNMELMMSGLSKADECYSLRLGQLLGDAGGFTGEGRTGNE